MFAAVALPRLSPSSFCRARPRHTTNTALVLNVPLPCLLPSLRSRVTTASTATKKAVALGTVALVPRPALEGDHSKCGDNKLGP